MEQRAKMTDYLLLHLCVAMFSFTGVFSKQASVQYNQGGLKNPLLYVFLFLMFLDCFVYAICWQRIIRKFPLNIGYANRSIYLLWSQLWAVLIYREHLTAGNLIGVVIVLIGVILVSTGKED